MQALQREASGQLTVGEPPKEPRHSFTPVLADAETITKR